MVADQAAQAVTPFARLSRWWMGGDNQGQYQVRAGEKMLDIGCGSGASLLVAKHLGAQAYGVEADPNVQQLARELGLRIHQGSIHDHPFPGECFDLVILNQVIEHIPEPGKALEAIASRLSPQGRIILVFPNRDSLWCRLFGAHWINWHIPYHLHHFNRSGFERLVTRHGLQVVGARTITPNLWTLLQLKASRVKITQGQPSPIWRTGGGGADGQSFTHRRVQRRLRMMLMTLVLGAFGVLNRCVDMFGQGDCLMVELRRGQDK
jgi:SAM-dependent methyltransferase